jgi:hypothetical protein
MNTIASEWEEFERAILAPANAGPTQVRETRRGFYAGAQVMLSLVLSQVSAGDEVTPEDEALMERIDAELKEFARAIERGEA